MISSAQLRLLIKRVTAEPVLALMLALGFSAGLPFLLVFSTLSAWLREAGVSRTGIGFLSYVALAYSFKFIWAPIIDTLDVPGLQFLGRRRAWMLVAQVGVAVGLAGIAFGDPSHTLIWIIICAFCAAFASATQDVAIDGWRIEAAAMELQGLMAAAYQLGYRLALLSAGAGALYLADFASWKISYFVMALLMGVGITACLLAPKFPGHPSPSPISASGHRPSWRQLYAAPLRDLVERKGRLLVPVLVLVALYRLPDFLSGVMANPLYIDLGFSKSDIATVTKVYGVWIGIAGVFAGGIAVLRLGLMPALLLGGIAAPSSHLMMALLASSGARLDLLTAAVSFENFASGFAGTALISYMSSLTSPAFAATQYALLSSLYALPGKLAGGLSGLMVDSFGYPAFFVLASTVGIPGTLLCLFIWRSSHKEASDSDEKIPLEPGDVARGGV
jgi:MFS transporter, PAT family, beta-lactamase induction signal transducer AmpG